MQHGIRAIAEDVGTPMGAGTRAAVEALEAERTGDLLAQLDEADADDADQFGAVPMAVAARRGRKRGARNVTTRRTWSYLMSQGYSDPLQSLLAFGSMSAGEIRRVYGIKDGEAVARLHLTAWRAAADYGHARMPVQVQVSAIPVIPISVSFGDYDALPAPDIGGQIEGEAQETAIPVLSMAYVEGQGWSHNADPHNAGEIAGAPDV